MSAFDGHVSIRWHAEAPPTGSDLHDKVPESKHRSFSESSPSLSYSLGQALDLKNIIPIKRTLKEHSNNSFLTDSCCVK